MAALTRGALLALLACDSTAGLSADVPTLAVIRARTTGDLAALRAGEAEPAQLRIALVWGRQWQPEPFCILPPTSREATIVQQAGCRDSFGFVPMRVAADVAATPGEPATLDLQDLPAADVMIGDLTARIAYGSLIAYDDRDGDGSLALRRPMGPSGEVELEEGPEEEPLGPPGADRLYGASFVSMTRPDQRVAYREGAFTVGAAFYPRAGCEPPPDGFSLLGAGGFSASQALAAALRGALPEQDPKTCTSATLDAATVSIDMEAPEPLADLACTVRGSGGSTRYREPPAEAPELYLRPWACTGLPDFGEHDPGGDGVAAQQSQLVVAGRPDDPCRSLRHYTLYGCRRDATCTNPRWDRRSSPPAWWPCPVDIAP